jgi:hypothetical protein
MQNKHAIHPPTVFRRNHDVDGVFLAEHTQLTCARNSAYQLPIHYANSSSAYTFPVAQNNRNVYPDPYSLCSSNWNNSAELYTAKELSVTSGKTPPFVYKGWGTVALLSTESNWHVCRLTLNSIDLVFYWVALWFLSSLKLIVRTVRHTFIWRFYSIRVRTLSSSSLICLNFLTTYCFNLDCILTYPNNIIITKFKQLFGVQTQSRNIPSWESNFKATNSQGNPLFISRNHVSSTN